LSAVNEGIGASFVGAFEDNEVRKILRLPVQVKPIGIIALGYKQYYTIRIWDLK
jgi:nitroreductase